MTPSKLPVLFLFLAAVAIFILSPPADLLAQDDPVEYTLRFAPEDGARYIYGLTIRGTSGDAIVTHSETFRIDVNFTADGNFYYTATGELIPDNAPLPIKFQRALFTEFSYTIHPDGTTLTDTVQPFPPFYNVPILPENSVSIGDTWSGGPVDILPDMNVGAIPFTFESTLTEQANCRGQQCAVIETVYTVAFSDDAVSFMPFLGIVEGDPTDEQLTKGALIGGVVEDSPAHLNGIEPGDMIIAAEEQRIRGWGGLEDIMPLIPPGHIVEFTVQRGDDEFDVNITPDAVPLANISATGGLHSMCWFSLETGIPLKIEIQSVDLEFTLENSDGETDQRTVDFSYLLEYERKSGTGYPVSPIT